MNDELNNLRAEQIVESQLRTTGRLPRLPVPKTDKEIDATADNITQRTLRAAGWNVASKILAARSAPPPAKDRVAEIVESQLQSVGRPIPRR